MGKDIKTYLTEEFHHQSARIDRVCFPYIYLNLSMVRSHGLKDGNLCKKLDTLFYREKRKPFASLPDDERFAYMMDHLKEAGLPDNDADFFALREQFIADNVEGPCQGIVRRIMENGGVTFSSNAFDSYIAKGVFWARPESFVGTSYCRQGGMYRWNVPQPAFLTSLDGATQEIYSKSVVNPNIDFSDVLPSAKDYELWLDQNQGAIEKPDNEDKTRPAPLRFSYVSAMC